MLVQTEDGSALVCYSVDEQSSKSLVVSQQKILLRAGAQAVYFVTGKVLGKVRLPSMELEFQEDAGHVVLDFAVTETSIITT